MGRRRLSQSQQPDDTLRPGVAELGESADTAPAEIDEPAASITDTTGAAEGGVAATVAETTSDNAATGATDADFAVVHGRVLVRDGQPTQIDVPHLVEAHNAATRTLLSRAGLM